MAHVSVTISGRQYRMACDDGQEHHLARLSHELDQRIAQLRTTFGEIGDMRLTVMAALLLADELAEARQRMRRVEEELLGLQHERIAASGRTDALQADAAAAINAAAERIERLTRLLAELVDGHRLALG
jgi:cell division protein ZapA